MFKKGEFIPQPSVEDLRMEEDEKAPYLIFKISDSEGNVVRKINSSATAGVNRVVWDLRYDSPSPVNLKDNKFEPTEKAAADCLLCLENILFQCHWL